LVSFLASVRFAPLDEDDDEIDSPSGFREYYMRRGVLSRYQLVYQNMIYQMSMKKEKALLDSIMPLMLARVLQDAITSHIEEDPNGLVPFSRTR